MLPLLASMRLRQWTKNGFLFAGLFFDRQLRPDNLPAVLHSLAGFALFCLLSSAVYIYNDIADVEADRQHPKKRLRPIASGKLPIPVALVAMIILLLIVFPCSYLLSPAFAAWALVYAALNLIYSAWAKHQPILDVLALAAFYVVRVGAGVSLIVVSRFSPWLYLFTTFLALFLGVGKRRAELNLLNDNADAARKALRGYTLPLLDQLITIVSTAAIFTYSLYTFSAPNLPDNHAMMLTVPFVIYGIFRYLWLVQVQHSGGAPEEVLFTDRPLQVTVGMWGLSILAIFYFL